MYYKPWVYFYVLDVLVSIIFLIGIIDMVYIWTRGKEKPLKKKINIKMIGKAFLFNVLLQTQILKLSKFRWVMHMCIFYGFMGLLLFYWQTPLFTSVIPIEFYISGKGASMNEFLNDFFGLILFIGLMMAITRRFIIKPEQLETILDDGVIVVWLFVIVITGYLLEATRFAISPYTPEMTYSFIGNAIRYLVEGYKIPEYWGTYVWVFHSTISMGFVAYIPFSKLRHIFASPLNNLINASEEAHRKDIYAWR